VFFLDLRTLKENQWSPSHNASLLAREPVTVLALVALLAVVTVVGVVVVGGGTSGWGSGGGLGLGREWFGTRGGCFDCHVGQGQHGSEQVPHFTLSGRITQTITYHNVSMINIFRIRGRGGRLYHSVRREIKRI
jgi:hypothetical protein